MLCTQPSTTGVIPHITKGESEAREGSIGRCLLCQPAPSPTASLQQRPRQGWAQSHQVAISSSSSSQTCSRYAGRGLYTCKTGPGTLSRRPSILKRSCLESKRENVPSWESCRHGRARNWGSWGTAKGQQSGPWKPGSLPCRALSIREPLLLKKDGAQWVPAAPLGTQKKQRNPSVNKAVPGVPQTNPRVSGTKSNLNLKPLSLSTLLGEKTRPQNRRAVYAKLLYLY